MPTQTKYRYALINDTVTRYFETLATPTLGEGWDSSRDKEITKSDLDAASTDCSGTGSVPIPGTINQFYLQYDVLGLTAALNASIATEVRLVRADGGATPDSTWHVTTKFAGPDLPEAGSYSYNWGILDPAEYIVTARPSGSYDTTKYLTQRYTVTGNTGDPTTDGGVNFAGGQYDANGLTAIANATVAVEFRVTNSTGTYGNTGWFAGELFADGPPPAVGSFRRLYGVVPAGQYTITARPAGNNDQTTWRKASLTVSTGSGGNTLVTGYRWNGAILFHSFSAYAAVSDNDTYEFYLEPLDGQTAPVAPFVFTLMYNTSETVSGLAANRRGDYSVGVDAGHWLLHVQKTSRPETRDTRPVLLIGDGGAETDMGDGITASKPIWGAFTMPAQTPGQTWSVIIPYGTAYNPNGSQATITAGTLPSYLTLINSPSDGGVKIYGTIPAYITAGEAINLIATGPGGTTPKTFTPAINAATGQITQVAYTWQKNNPVGGQASTLDVYVQAGSQSLEASIGLIGVGSMSSFSPMDTGSYQSGTYNRHFNLYGAGAGYTAVIQFRQTGTTAVLLSLTLPTFPTSANSVALTIVYPASGDTEVVLNTDSGGSGQH